MDDYFTKLKERGRKLDEGINDMSKIWSASHIHIGGHIRFAVNDKNEENLEETAKAKETSELILKSTRELKTCIQKDLSESEESLKEMQKLLNDSKTVCDDLIQKCSDIETLFVENGYIPLKEEKESFSNSDSKNTTLSNSEIPYVESTPYIPWKSKLKTFDASTPSTEIKIKNKYLQEDFVTPLAQRLLASRLMSRTIKQSPREPVLSRYCKEL